MCHEAPRQPLLLPPSPAAVRVAVTQGQRQHTLHDQVCCTLSLMIMNVTDRSMKTVFKIRLSTTLFLILKCLNLKTQSSWETAVSTKPLFWKMEKSWRNKERSRVQCEGRRSFKGTRLHPRTQAVPGRPGHGGDAPRRYHLPAGPSGPGSSGLARPSLSCRPGLAHTPGKSPSCHRRVALICEGPSRSLCHSANMYYIFQVRVLCRVWCKAQDSSVCAHLDAAGPPAPQGAAGHGATTG